MDFKAHQDAPAFAAFEQKYYITAMISIDQSNLENGCLEMAYGHHKKGLLGMDSDMTLSSKAAERLSWEPLPTQPGDLVLFDLYIPHRSGPNTSSRSRRVMYVTYNPQSSGDKRQEYYRNKRNYFSSSWSEPGKDYSNTGLYNIGNPIKK